MGRGGGFSLENELCKKIECGGREKGKKNFFKKFSSIAIRTMGG